MKDTNERFDDKLKERLLNYEEEPDKDLWKGIAQGIVPVRAEPVWVIWSTRLSVVVLLSAVSLFYLTHDGFHETPRPDQTVSDASGVGITGKPAPHQPADTPATKDIRTSKSEIDVSRLSFPAPDQHQLTGMPFDVAAQDQNSSNLFNSPPTLSILRTDEIIFVQSSSDTIPLRQSKSNKAQSVSDSTERKKSSRLNRKLRKHQMFSLYLTAMPTFGYQRIESNSSDNILIESIKRVPAFSRDRLGVRIEAGVQIQMSKRWRGFGGVLYYQRAQTITYTEKQVDTLVFHTEPGGDLIVEPQLNYLSRSTEYALKNVGVQVGISYQLWTKTKKRITAREALSSENFPNPKRAFLHVVGSGMELHRPINGTKSFQRAEGFPNPSMYVFFNVYYRLQYPNMGRLRAIFQPTLNYSVYINHDLNAPFYVKPYGLGLNFGCTYHFR